MDIKEQVTKMDSMIAKGAIVEAVKEFFAQDARTSDYNDLTTSGKQQMVEKMEGFTGAIEHVNGITLHRSITEGYVSASEFTFDFNMKDGSKILWHEIIRRIWNLDGEVTHEEYFNA